MFLFSIISGCGTPMSTQQSFTPSPTYNPEITDGTDFSHQGTSQGIKVTVIGCNMSVDVNHSLGEVTDAYVNLRNEGSEDFKDICMTLSASDEGGQHPDKTRCFANLPQGFEVTNKLTVDTTWRIETLLSLDLTSQGRQFYHSGFNCKQIQDSLVEKIRNLAGQIKKFR
jgi:hypothetical protein